MSGAVAPKEEALFHHQRQPGDNLTEREALAVSLAERIALDPHTVTDEFFETLKGTFSDDEIVEMVLSRPGRCRPRPRSCTCARGRKCTARQAP